MSRLVIIALIVLGTGVISIAAWVFLPSEGGTQNGAATPAAQPTTGEDVRQRRDDFFGGDPDRDVRSGQEMKPQW